MVGAGKGPVPPGDPIIPEGGGEYFPSSSEQLTLRSLVREPDFDHEGKEIIFLKADDVGKLIYWNEGCK